MASATDVALFLRRFLLFRQIMPERVSNRLGLSSLASGAAFRGYTLVEYPNRVNTGPKAMRP